MYNYDDLNSILPKLESIAKFFKFNRKKIKREIIKDLEKIDDSILKKSNKIVKLNNKVKYENEKNNKINKLNENLKTENKKISKENNKISKLNKDLKIENKKISRKNNKISKLNKDLKIENKEISKKFNLTTRILNSKPKNLKYVQEFENVIKNEFLEFANSEKSLAEEAEVLMKLQEVKEQLNIISTFPEINNKTVVAIGGGFSAGKSTFLNSFIKE